MLYARHQINLLKRITTRRTRDCEVAGRLRDLGATPSFADILNGMPGEPTCVNSSLPVFELLSLSTPAAVGCTKST